jgi:hypothetical protein
MDEALIKALNDFTDEQKMSSLDDVLAEPDRYTYDPDA